MTKPFFTAAEQSVLVLAAYKVQSDSNIALYLEKIEKIIVNKMHESSEIERLLKLSPKQ